MTVGATSTRQKVWLGILCNNGGLLRRRAWHLGTHGWASMLVIRWFSCKKKRSRHAAPPQQHVFTISGGVWGHMGLRRTCSGPRVILGKAREGLHLKRKCSLPFKGFRRLLTFTCLCPCLAVDKGGKRHSLWDLWSPPRRRHWSRECDFELGQLKKKFKNRETT